MRLTRLVCLSCAIPSIVLISCSTVPFFFLLKAGMSRVSSGSTGIPCVALSLSALERRYVHDPSPPTDLLNQSHRSILCTVKQRVGMTPGLATARDAGNGTWQGRHCHWVVLTPFGDDVMRKANRLVSRRVFESSNVCAQCSGAEDRLRVGQATQTGDVWEDLRAGLVAELKHMGLLVGQGKCVSFSSYGWV